MRDMKPVLISGVQPSGRLHIGNYVGALKNFVDLQNSGKYECFYFIADLHSLTENFDPKQKPAQIFELAVEFLSAGIDPEKSILFVQSHIPEHVGLTWILNTITPMGELSRMTQFKDKSERMDVNVGLFDYPVLMAADILLYQTAFVPVGDDQLQHIEFARMIARKFNSKFGKTFVEPKAILTQTPRIMSLDDPTKKMSKSLPKGCLYISDSPDEIRTKIKTAVTDSGKTIAYDESRPGIANLLRIYSAFSGETIKDIVKQRSASSYVDFKNALADVVVKALEPFRKERERLMKDMQYIHETLGKGAGSAWKVANKTFTDVQQKIGIL